MILIDIVNMTVNSNSNAEITNSNNDNLHFMEMFVFVRRTNIIVAKIQQEKILTA